MSRCFRSRRLRPASAAIALGTTFALVLGTLPGPAFAVTAGAPALAPPPATAAGKADVSAMPNSASAAAAARALGHPVAAEDAGSATQRVLMNPDGSRSAELYAAPAFHRVAGSWQPLDAAVAGAGTTASPFTAAGLPRPVRFGLDAAHLLRLELDGGPVTLSAAGLQLGRPTRSGSTITFTDVATDTDLQLAVQPTGVQANLVLKSGGGPTSFTFHLADPAHQLGRPQPAPDGGAVFSRPVADGERLELAPASAYVPADVPADLGPGVDLGSAHQSVVAAGDGFDVIDSVDADWLAGKRASRSSWTRPRCS